MTELAVKRDKLRKRNRVILIVSLIIIAALLVLWGIKFYITNSRAVHQEIEYYEMGEFIDIGDNFFYSANENLKGYSIRVNGVRLENYREYIESNGGEVRDESFSADFPEPKYVVVMDMTVKNEGNTEGYLNSRYFRLNNGSLSLVVDYEILGLVEEYFTGFVSFKLVENTEADMTMVFGSMGSSLGLEYDGVNRRLEEEEFEFSICEWPVRKVIKMKMDK